MLSTIDLIHFIDLTMLEKKMVLSWRNHSSIKQWMYNSSDIALDEHLAFIESLKESTDKFYFLVKQGNNYIGVIDFTNINNRSSKFGLYANIELKGMGNILLGVICEYAFKILKLNKLTAEVFDYNEKAINLYKRFNFTKVDTKILNNQKIICMKLSNEDR